MATAAEASIMRTGVKELSVKAVLSRFAKKAAGWPILNWPLTGRNPTELLYTPFDMHLADPSLAHEFYHGRFPLAGRVVQIGASSPFLIEAPSREWEDCLHSFGWLNHMMAAQTELADAHARSLTLDWIREIGARPIGAAWAPVIAARRLSSWLAHADMLFSRTAMVLQKQLLKQIGIHIRYLRLAYAGEKNDYNRLIIAISLAMAALVVATTSRKRAERQEAQASKRLAAELSWQILPDGGHISRNPAILLELLICLIPLQYAYLQRNIEPPSALIVAIDRMLPALRFFRHQDGSLANFNGVGPISPQAIDVVLAVDDAADAPLASHAPHSGYQRLTAGDTIVIADTGHSYSKKLTKTANAGCLAFELSSGMQRFIVNCGIDPYGTNEIRLFGRLTAAHSTAIIDDTSSCLFADGDNPHSWFLPPLIEVQVDRIEEADSFGFIAKHNGYQKSFNIAHERMMTLSYDGMELSGRDTFYQGIKKTGFFAKSPPDENEDLQIAVRFHVHPDISIAYEKLALEDPDEETDVICLQGRDEEAWTFLANCPIHLEDSIYFSGLRGPKKTQQLVLNFALAEQDSVEWKFSRKL